MSQFEKGDVVQLKSGGPQMTVADMGDYGPVGPKNGVKCVWFVQVKGVPKAEEEVFDEVVLKKYQAPGAGLRIGRE